MPQPLALGIEIGGTKLQLGLGRGDGRILAKERRVVVPSHGAEGILGQIVDALGPLTQQLRVDRDAIGAVGIGFGGPVDAGRGVVAGSHQVPGWHKFPLADWVRRILGVARVRVENDADAAGLAEARIGAGMGRSPILYLTIGSGIGGGLILDGKIYRGAGAGAIEIGHLWVNDRGDSDLGHVTLENAASGWAIAEAARRYAERLSTEVRRDWLVCRLAGGDTEAITTELVAEAAREGDTAALLLLDTAVSAMARALRQAVTLLAPHRIILGGGVSLIGEDLWLAPIRRLVDAYVFPPFRGTFDIVAASLGVDVVVHGALALTRDLLPAKE